MDHFECVYKRMYHYWTAVSLLVVLMIPLEDFPRTV